MLREALGHGAFVCEPCNDEIELEVGLAYPSWWTEKEPPALNAVPPPTTYNCAGCGNEHPKDHVCLVELKKYVSHPPGDDDLSDDWFRVRAHVVCPEPRMNVVTTPTGAKKCMWCPRAVGRGNPELCDRCIVNGPPPRSGGFTHVKK
jgi:hypothetical protein